MRQGPKRRLIWARTLFTNLAVAETGTSVDLLSTFEAAYSADLIGVTVVRIIGELQWEFTADPSRAIVGIMKGSETLDNDDLAPTTNLHLDWMYWSAVTGLAQGAGTAAHQSFDLRGMRKIDELTETLWWVADRTAGAGVAAVAGAISVLVKLP